MTDDQKRDTSRQRHEAEIAQEIFARDRGAQRDIPLADFLTHVEEQVRKQVRTEGQPRGR